eukprot:434983_1
MSVKIKVSYKGKKVRWRYESITNEPELSTLKEFIVDKYNLDNQDFLLQYKNKQNKQVNIINNTCLMNAFQSVNKILVVFVEVTPNMISQSKPNEHECQAADPLIINCHQIKRLLKALNKFGPLELDDNKQHQNIIVKYFNTKYKQFVDDFNHLVNAHHQDFDSIASSLSESHEYSFTKCDILNCALTMRHHDVKKKDEFEKARMMQSHDEQLIFYRGLLDNLHFYLVHLYEVGLRIPSITIDESEYNYSTDSKNEHDVDCYDKKFSRSVKICETLKKTEAVSRYVNSRRNNKSKFNMKTTARYISLEDDMKSTSDFMSGRFTKKQDKYITVSFEKTWSDGLFSYIGNAKLQQFLYQEEYDSDAIKQDVEGDYVFGTSNIFQCVKNMQCVSTIKAYVRTISDAASFDVGYIFYYWPYYKKKTILPTTDLNNIYDHGGHKICDLFIHKKYATFKEEISNYKNIQWDDYRTYVVIKANKYLASEFVRALQAPVVAHLHYDIKEGTPLQFKNLVSLILYTDFSDLCTEFSSTFRAVKPNESLSSIKTANQEFWWMSKTIRETVQIYGANGAGDGTGAALKGPFYTGVSHVIVVPELNIRLCCPTSSSKVLSVAMMFGGDKGMVIQLNNSGDISGRRNLRAFNVSWLSKYKEEAEYIYCGGDFRIRIECIRIMETSQNFEIFQHAMFWFDCMLTGSLMMKCNDDVTIKDRTIISTLINWKLGTETNDMPYDLYILQSFQAFCEAKRYIVINLEYMDRYFNLLHPLIMHSVVPDDKNHKLTHLGFQYYEKNLFRKRIFQLFPNLGSIIIYCVSNENTSKSYSLSLFQLLNLINKSTVANFETTIKATWESVKYNRRSWLWSVWSSINKSKIISTYKRHNWLVSLNETENNCNLKEDCVFISRM